MADAIASCEPFLHLLHIAGIAQLQAGVANALAAGEQAIRELLGLLMDQVPTARLFLLLAVALLLVSRAVSDGTSARASAAAAGDPLAELATDALRLLREHKGAALLSAVLAGLILGRRR